MVSYRTALLLPCLSFCLIAQTLIAQTALRPKDVREMGKGGADAIPKLAALLTNTDVAIRLEAVKQICEIGTQHSLDPLIQATRDSDASIQIQATDGLVNFYLPGYLKTGIASSVRRVGTSIKGRFTDTNDQVIDPYIAPRAEVIAALGALAKGGASPESRANAARAIGILRGKAAIPDLVQALHSKDTALIYESLVAVQKIRDPEAASSIAFLLRDLDSKVQIAAIETTGLLLNQSALPDLVDVLNHARDNKVRRAALTAIAMLPDPSSREIYARYLGDKDEKLRAAAARRLRALEKSGGFAHVGESLSGRRQDFAAALAGIRTGDAGKDRGLRIQSAAIPDRHAEQRCLSRRSISVLGRTGTRSGGAKVAVPRAIAGNQGRKNLLGARDGAQRRSKRYTAVGKVEPRWRPGSRAGRIAGHAEFAGPHLN